jgi:cyclopropane-fatty-acyl-phospholipid synthase
MISMVDLSDRAILPDKLIRFGIRRLDKKRLQAERRKNYEDQGKALFEFIESMRSSPIAVQRKNQTNSTARFPRPFFKKFWVSISNTALATGQMGLIVWMRPKHKCLR